MREGAEEISPESEIKKILPFAQSRSFTQSSLAQEILFSQMEIFVETIINFLRWFCQKKLYGGWRIQSVEEKLQTRFPQNENIILEGKIDCVLSSGEDFAIVDFKNTSGAIPNSNLTLKASPQAEDSLGDFQMPMYFKLWESNSKDEISLARFVPIKINSFAEEGQEVIIKEGRATTKHATREDFINFTIPLFDEYVRKMCEAVKAAE